MVSLCSISNIINYTNNVNGKTHMEERMSLLGSWLVFDLKCHAVGYYWETAAATHQSFTLVFLCFLRGTSRFQPCGNRHIYGYIWWNDNATIVEEQVNQCTNKAFSTLNSSLQVTAWSIWGAPLCWQASECAALLVQPASASDNEEGARCSVCLQSPWDCFFFFCMSTLQTSLYHICCTDLDE